MRPGIPLLDRPAQTVMTFNPAVVGAEDTLGDAAATMVQGGFRHLPVVDPDGRLVGILSERDLRERLGTEVEQFPRAGAEALAERVEACMHANPIAVTPDTTLREVLRLLVEERVGAVPVTEEDERLVGVISYVDVLEYVRLDEELREDARSGHP